MLGAVNFTRSGPPPRPSLGLLTPPIEPPQVASDEVRVRDSSGRELKQLVKGMDDLRQLLGGFRVMWLCGRETCVDYSKKSLAPHLDLGTRSYWTNRNRQIGTIALGLLKAERIYL